MRTRDHESRVVYTDDRVTYEQLVNLTTHIDARSVIWYQRWVDKHG